MMDKKRFGLFVILTSLMLILSSCSGFQFGDSSSEAESALSQVQSGTQGVEVSFVSGYPPYSLYDIADFIMLLEVENKGAYDIGSTDCYLQVTGFDPNIIKGINYIQSCGSVDGKNVYNLDGGWNQVEYTSSNIDIPDGSLSYSPTLNLVWCYAYQTEAAPSICVDPNFYQVTSDVQSCEPQDVSMGGGQGGPVSVSYVGVDMVGDTAIFEISVRNSGSGRVLSPYADISNCGSGEMDWEDLDRVSFNVEMTGGTLIECTPESRMLRLSNGAAKAVCSFSISGTTSYETPLHITLDYNYIESDQRSVEIVKTP